MGTEKLFKTPLTKIQKKNTELNHQEFIEGKNSLKSCPRRIVFELTNRCNFKCIMCGREAANFQTFDMPVSTIKHFEPIFPYIEEATLHGWGEGTLHPQFNEILRLLNKYPRLRKYFVTNGKTLPKIMPAIFEHHVDLVAISLDGATPETNNSIRKGGNLKREIASLQKLIGEKERRGLDFPYVNFVFTAMRRNIHELPDMVTLARDLGVPEVKVVYLTVFKKDLLHESLLDNQEMVRGAFSKAVQRAERFKINLKLPAIQGEDEAGTLRHKPCAFPWRDLYIGSDGFIRPCQSSAEKLGNVSEFRTIEEVWNSEKMQEFRRHVNNEKSMPKNCHFCYHSTCANWDLPHSFVQLNQNFAPRWNAKQIETFIEE